MIRVLRDEDRTGFGLRHFVLILGILLWAAGGVHLLSLIHRQGQLRQALSDLRGQVAVFEAGEGGRSLEELLVREQARYASLVREWEGLEPRIGQFREKSIAEIFPRNPEGRIDFKIAIIEARQLLQKLSQEHITVLPPQLGIPDSIAESEHADIRQGQLTATLRILVKCIRLDIPEIIRVQSLPPIRHPRIGESGADMLVYPIYMVFESPYETLARLLHEIHNKDLLFSLQHLHLESQFPRDPERLRIHAVWNAVGFSVLDLPEGGLPHPEHGNDRGSPSRVTGFSEEDLF